MSILRKFLFALLLPIILILSGCDGAYRDDPRLQRIEKALNEHNIEEEKALSLRDSLQSIPDSELREGERHYKALLFIKASDKAYVTHTSDSLYLTVHHYFSSHNKEALPEVLYYGGRVYSDIGDYPTALKYFQEALDATDESRQNLNLRRRILTQTGRLLDRMRLFDQSLEYIDQAIAIDSLLGGAISLSQNLQLAGAISLRANKLGKAGRYLSNVEKLKDSLPALIREKNKKYLARLEFLSGNYGKALSYIRSMPDSVHPLVDNETWAIAAQAYMAAGYPDTAYLYATRLIASSHLQNKRFGYSILLRDAYSDSIPIDSLRTLYRNYHKVLDDYFDENQNRSFLLKNAGYNYRIHEREKRKAEEKQVKYLKYLFVCVVIVFLLLGLVVVMRYRSILSQRKMLLVTEEIRKLKRELDNTASKPSGNGIKIAPSSSSTKDLRENIKKELLALYEKNKGTLESFNPPSDITGSAPYLKLKELITAKKIVPLGDEIWKELENVITAYYPDFISRLMILSGGEIKEEDIRTSLLLKLGISNRAISNLVGRSDSAIISRRKALGKKLFEVKMELEVIDGVIRLM